MKRCVRFTPCLVLGKGFQGRWIEWCYLRFDNIQDGGWLPSWNDEPLRQLGFLVVYSDREKLIWQQLLGHPYVSTGGLLFCPWCFFLFLRHAFSKFPWPIALKRCHLIGIWLNFIMQVQKLWGGALPQKNRGQKHAKFRSILDHFRLWSRISAEWANISKIGKCYKLRQFLLRLMKKSGGLWFTNGLELHVSLDPLKCIFGRLYFSPYGVLRHEIFTRFRDWPNLDSAHPKRDGDPQKF